jgi:hypothetical protein
MIDGQATMLAAFLTPALMYGGLGAVSLPIIIHLLARRRFRRIRWAAIEFLLDAERRNRRRLRMEEWILLALRCLAIALLGAMLARPFFTPKNAAALWGGSRRTERVFVLDDSLSMAYDSAEGQVFSRAKTAVRRLMDAIRREAPDDTVTLIRMSSADQPVETGVFLDEEQSSALSARVEAMSATQRAVDATSVMTQLADWLQRGEKLLNVVVYVVSDFQRNDWTARESRSESGGSATHPLAALKQWAGEQRGLRVVLINVADVNAVNRAVTDLRFGGGPAVAGTSATAKVEVHNYSDQAVENFALQASVGTVPQPGKTLPILGGGQSVSTEMSVEFLLAGDEAVRVDIPSDGLAADDSRFAAAGVSSAIRVLLVNGEQSADGFENETTFLATALRPEGDVFSGNEVTVIEESQFEAENLGSYQAVVAANAYRISEAGAAALERFTRDGGGVLFFLGDQVEAGLYNQTLYRDGAGILPAKIGEVIRAEREVHLSIRDRLHPVAAGVSREGDPLGIGRIPFYQYWSCEFNESNATSEANPVRVVATFDDSAERPAIVERSFGEGKVMLITTTADKEWHLWPDHPTYVPLMIELVRHVARGSSNGDGVTVGAPISIPVDPGEFEPDVQVRTPGYPAERESSVTATSADESGGPVATWRQTDAAGMYQFVLRSRTGGEVVRLAAVNVDARESDLGSSREDELRRAMPDVPFEYIQGLAQLPSATGESKVEFWKPALLTLGSLLLAEQMLAWWWGRRR